jgi:hypothetical protein
LLEIPISTVRFGQRNWPAGGGGFFRLLPYAMTRQMVRRINGTDGQAAIFYFHPWEIDVEQPRIAGVDRKTRFRHYLNLRRTEHRLRRLLADFVWGRVDEAFPIDGEPAAEQWPPLAQASAESADRPGPPLGEDRVVMQQAAGGHGGVDGDETYYGQSRARS